MEPDLGLSVAQETRRLRILYNPWTTAQMFDQVEDLKLALDFSQWVVVAELLSDDQLDIVRLAGEPGRYTSMRALVTRKDHQAPDPRPPEWEKTVGVNLQSWEIRWQEQERGRLDTSIVVPEFGPPHYRQTLPYTGVPTTDLWDVCNWMTARVRHQFAERTQIHG